LAGVFPLVHIFFSYRDIIFNLHLYDLCPLFQRHNEGVKQGFGVYKSFNKHLP